jgi:NAD(P)-dependent dehydrogenase (short-subunit alcohol dehydrogenase family)
MSPNLFSVAGKNVLVTGGSRGIGLMIAKGFVQGGAANVLVTSRDVKACEKSAKSLQKVAKECSSSSSVHYVASNVGSREGCQELAEYTKKIFNNKLDVLVNNAGTSWGEPLERESGKANWGWDRVLDLNVKGIFYLTRECIPMLKRSSNEDPGRIINIGSIAGMITQEAPTHAYDTSKAAVHHLTKKLAADLAPQHITVNAIAPGYVPSRMSMGLKAYGATDEKISNSIPLGRMGNDDDMAGAALYFSSKAGSWTTGVILNVDGGATTMQMPLASL